MPAKVLVARELPQEATAVLERVGRTAIRPARGVGLHARPPNLVNPEVYDLLSAPRGG